MIVKEQIILSAYLRYANANFKLRVAEFKKLVKIADSTPIGASIICPVCGGIFIKASAKNTCSSSCRTSLFSGIDINQLEQMAKGRIYSVHFIAHLNKILKLIDTYVYNSKQKVSTVICCPVCSSAIYKDSYQHSFCDTKCKDKFWNTINTRRFNNRR